jgi:hypothetical protein
MAKFSVKLTDETTVCPGPTTMSLSLVFGTGR